MKQLGPDWCADDVAFDTIETVYAALKREGRVPVAPLAALYQDEEVEFAFKKALLFRIKEMHLQRGEEALVIKQGALLNRLKWFSILAALPLWVFLAMRWPIRPAGSPKSIQVALRVYTTDFGLRGDGTRKIDWLLGGGQLHKDNTLFVVEKPISEKYKTELAACRYAIEDVSGAPARLFQGLVAWTQLLIASFRAPDFFIEVATRGWLDYLRWTTFLEQWRPRHYVAYNHHHYDHIWRNILLRKAGCASWYYVHSVHDRSAFYHAASDNPLGRGAGPWWAYLSYDHEVHWGVRDAHLHRNMCGQSRVYHTWGPLWSSNVRRESGITALIERRKHTVGKVDAVIAVFDTSFEPEIFNNTRAREFFEALVVMLERPEWTKRLMLFKPKHDPKTLRAQLSAETARSLTRFITHPQCLTLPAKIDPGVAIAEADLTLSVAFTSPTVEALGARSRALFFDPTGEFMHSYYDQFPNLVAHDRESLEQLCEHWLGLTDTDFQTYLDSYMAPEFGGYLDGGAVARFRSALASEY